MGLIHQMIRAEEILIHSSADIYVHYLFSNFLKMSENSDEMPKLQLLRFVIFYNVLFCLTGKS